MLSHLTRPTLVLVTLGAVLLPAAARGTIRLVPSVYPTIPAAITASASGDTVLIGPGVYPGNVDAGAKLLNFIGEQGSAMTILDGGGTVRVLRAIGGTFQGLTFRNGRNNGLAVLGTSTFPKPDCLISGCEFRGNISTSSGGGLHLSTYNLDDVVVRQCVFEGNSAAFDGGAIWFENNWMTLIENNIFRSNRAENWGGALYGDGADVVNNLFLNNSAGVHGGAIAAEYTTIRNNTLVGNRKDGTSTSRGAGIHALSGGIVINNIVVGDAAGTVSGPGIYYSPSCCVTTQFQCNDSWGHSGPNLVPSGGPWPNNFSADPEFCDPMSGSYFLNNTSPCAGNTASCGLIGAFPVGCEAVVVEGTTWSRIKLLR